MSGPNTPHQHETMESDAETLAMITGVDQRVSSARKTTKQGLAHIQQFPVTGDHEPDIDDVVVRGID